MANGADDIRTVPYLPYPTFKGFIRDLKGTVVPTRIDRSIMKHMSGTDQSQLRTAFRFFGLAVGDDLHVTEAFRAVVAAYDTDLWKVQARDLIRSYDPIVAGVDIKTCTPGQLDEAFKVQGSVDGSVLKKAVRFFTSVAEDAGLELSPLFQRRRKGPGAVRSGPRRKSTKSAGTTDMDDAIAPPPEGLKEFRLGLPGRPDAKLWLPADINEAEWAMLDTYMRAFIKLATGDND